MREHLYKKIATYLTASILGIPIVLSGQTIGPFASRFDRYVTALGLNRCEIITFRDLSVSRDRVKRIGVTKPVLIDAADDAMKLSSLTSTAKRELLESEMGDNWQQGSSSLLVALNMKSSLMYFKDFQRVDEALEGEVNCMAEIGNYLVSKYGAKLIFVPTDINPSQGDIGFHQQVSDRISNSCEAHLVNSGYNAVQIKGLLAGCDLAIGTRYHFCVFAASELVPFLGIASGVYQRTKLEGLSNLCGIPESFYLGDMESSQIDQLKPYIDCLILNRTRIKDRLASIVPLLATRSALATEYSLRFLRA
jgi:polysaccharide pyruvyl transferase WcaK-like protein